MSVAFRKAIVVGEFKPLAETSTFSFGSLICGCANVYCINVFCKNDIIMRVDPSPYRNFDFGNYIQ